MNNLCQKRFFDSASRLDFDNVKLFLTQGGDVNAKDEVDNNVLGCIADMSLPDVALRSKLINILKLLIEFGIEIEHKNKWGASAVCEAIGSGFVEFVEIFQSLDIRLTSHISLNQFLFYQWPRHPTRQQREDFPKVLKMLLNEKPNLELVSEEHQGLTALQIACKEGATSAILQLLEAGANPNGASGEHMRTTTPLELICNYAFRAKCECFTAIDALLTAGAQPNLFSNDRTQADNSKSALMWSVIYGGNTLKVVERLLEAGANVDDKDGKKNDAIYYAKASKRQDLVDLLAFYKKKPTGNQYTQSTN
jgi:ankyrin repeat protein